jgi:hypothetical protein
MPLCCQRLVCDSEAYLQVFEPQIPWCQEKTTFGNKRQFVFCHEKDSCSVVSSRRQTCSFRFGLKSLYKTKSSVVIGDCRLSPLLSDVSVTGILLPVQLICPTSSVLQVTWLILLLILSRQKDIHLCPVSVSSSCPTNTTSCPSSLNERRTSTKIESL